MSFDSILTLGQTALELGLISSLTVLALFLSYSMLNVCDLSTDGCFTLGAVVGASVALSGHPFLAIPPLWRSAWSPASSRRFCRRKWALIVCLPHHRQYALYSVNIGIMNGASLLNLNNSDTVFTKMRSVLENTPLAGQYKLIVIIITVVLVAVVLGLFLRTRLGLAIRATGNNPDMVRSSSINPVKTTIIGLCISNAFTALSGCLLAQSQKSVSIDIGTGMVTVALASLLIGGAFFGKGKIPLRIFGMVVGAFVFRLVYTIALRFNLPAFMLKFVSSVIVILAISGPYLKKQLPYLKRRFGKERTHA